MTKQLLTSIPEYWQLPENERPTTYEEIVNLVHRKAGIWQILVRDTATGEIIQEQITENVITDNGALSLFKNCMNYTAGGIAVANIIAIDQSLGYTTLSTTIASGGTVTSIVVGALTGPTIPSGSTLLIGAGGATTLTVVTTAAITGAGTISVTSTPGPGSSISSGANIKVVPTTTDVSSLSAPVSYTAALPTGQFTISGSGVGNRAMVVTNSGNYLFSTASNSNTATATVGTYTSAWLVNTNPVAATTQTFVHVAFDAPCAVSSSQTVQVTITEKL